MDFPWEEKDVVVVVLFQDHASSSLALMTHWGGKGSLTTALRHPLAKVEALFSSMDFIYLLHWKRRLDSFAQFVCACLGF